MLRQHCLEPSLCNNNWVLKQTNGNRTLLYEIVWVSYKHTCSGNNLAFDIVIMRLWRHGMHVSAHFSFMFGPRLVFCVQTCLTIRKYHWKFIIINSSKYDCHKGQKVAVAFHRMYVSTQFHLFSVRVSATDSFQRPTWLGKNKSTLGICQTNLYKFDCG